MLRVSIFLLALGAGGCVGDDVCGDGLTRLGERCVRADGGPPDGAAADQLVPGGDRALGDGGGCHAPAEAALLTGAFVLTTTISESTCTLGGFKKGEPFAGELAFAAADAGGDALRATLTTDVEAFSGPVTKEAGGALLVEAAGDVLGFSFTASARACFTDDNNGDVELSVGLAMSGEAICDLVAAGTLTRKP